MLCERGFCSSLFRDLHGACSLMPPSVTICPTCLQACIAAFSPGTAAAVCACAMLLLAASLALGRRVYASFAWRQSASPAGAPAVAAACGRECWQHRRCALAGMDASLIALLSACSIINGASPAGRGTIPLLVVAGTVALPLLGGLLLALCHTTSHHPRAQVLAGLLQPLALLPPLLVLFGGLTAGEELTQDHGQAYLILLPLLFMVARAAVWWSAGEVRQQAQNICSEAGGPALATSPPAQLPAELPAELSQLLAGAWLQKLSAVASWTILAGCGGKHRSRQGSSAGAAGPGSDAVWRWRWFKLSHDCTSLQWDSTKYIMFTAVQSLSCSEAELTIRLALALEPDLVLRCAPVGE